MTHRYTVWIADQPESSAVAIDHLASARQSALWFVEYYMKPESREGVVDINVRLSSGQVMQVNLGYRTEIHASVCGHKFIEERS